MQGELAFRAISYTPWPVDEGFEASGAEPVQTYDHACIMQMRRDAGGESGRACATMCA
jgi:hypothetical protein